MVCVACYLTSYYKLVMWSRKEIVTETWPVTDLYADLGHYNS